MQMPSLNILEYDRLKDVLLNQVRTPLGRVLVDDLRISQSEPEIVLELKRTTEGVTYMREGTALDIHDLPDPSSALGKLNIADINLEPFEILNLLRLISVGVGLRDTFHHDRAKFPLLNEICSAIPNLRNLYQKQRGRISPTGEVEDFASPELREVRMQIARLRTQIQKSLEHILKRAQEDHALRDDFITIRNERFVIPIRNDNRGAVAGVVHGMSSSGQTVFVEPLETINLNNELVGLHEREQAEVTKVLFAITEDFRDERDALALTADAVGLMDFTSAKARLSISQNAIEPTINTNGKLRLEDARHPLLEANLKAQRTSIIPISIELDKDNKIMVVSGPNAGGKTVVLKTVGLLSLMAQAGLHVPARDAELPVFRQVHADIGDHQSIAANLSTFTAHIRNIGAISEEIEEPALILLDEVGTGTDPEEGSALGVAIVDYFCNRGAHVIVTTHYSGLKVYAANTPGVINSSVEFDEKTLKPTYRLISGLAGSSSGIEIARRFGLPKAITDKAAEKIKTSSVEANEYLKKLKEQFDHHHQTVVALEEERTAVAEKYTRLEVEFQKRETERQKEFQIETAKIIDEFVTKAAKITSTIEDAAIARRVRKDVERRTAELKAESRSIRERMSRSDQLTDSAVLASSPNDDKAITDLQSVSHEMSDYKIGDRVLILSLNNEGLIESVDDEEIGVQVGALRFRERRENLRLIQSSDKAKSKKNKKSELPKGISVLLAESSHDMPASGELNVIGKTVNEATAAADKFLDAAFMDNYDKVRIVHGVGMGALKRAISELLSDHPHVAAFYAAPPSEGGNGATVVELRK